MSTEIAATAVSYGNEYGGSIDLACDAAEQCISGSGISKENIGVLIYTGVYRDKNIIEPSIACLVQQKLEMNSNPLELSPAGTGTSSFDIQNGVCGFIQSIFIADSFLNNGSVNYVLIVGGDSHPSNMDHPEFPYTRIGSALILKRSSNGKSGFSNFRFDSSKEVYTGREGFFNMNAYGNRGRENVAVITRSDLRERLMGYVIKKVKEMYKGIPGLDKTRLIISQPFKGFGLEVAGALRMYPENVMDLYDRFGDPLTSAMTLQLHYGKYSGFLDGAERLLFIAANPDLSLACAEYLMH